MNTPLPAARPSSFITNGGTNFSIKLRASSFEVAKILLAVGMFLISHIDFVKLFDDSKKAASLVGPKLSILFLFRLFIKFKAPLLSMLIYNFCNIRII